MKNFALTLIGLAALSTASFAGQPGGGMAGGDMDRDPPSVFNDYIPHAKKPVVDTKALSTSDAGQIKRDADFYLNKSQLR